MIPKDTFADGLRYAARIAGDFDPFTEMWSVEDRHAGERALDLLEKRLNEVADQYAPGPVTAPEVRIGGEPPKLEIGMVVEYRLGDVVFTSLVDVLPNPHGPKLIEVRAPWGGPVIWRAK